ncbi:HRDC domain-containing protein [Aliikangiella sp. G2MR2-5]|uniref:ribonuclease D n=1 Tax=Aliikangiella sp. G2MR2-5 TaxID=2788943 RepID=UPI0018AC1BB8|nr:HRDC domain-containing protein [Aliikangiella sp. G2MR2-5]
MSQDHGLEPVWIANNSEFASLSQQWLERASQPSFALAIDTEFERRTTYYPTFALLQVFDGSSVYIIDPQKVSSNQAFKELCQDPRVIKVMHAGKEDLEVLFHSWDCKLDSVFDTQVAYNFLIGESSIGYAALVKKLLNIDLDKEETQSDWMARPLTQSQVQYAANDVIYLYQIYLQLSQKIENIKAYRLFKAETEEVCELSIAPNDPAVEYRRAKDVTLLNSRQLGLFKELYIWREQLAKENNRTRNHILRDQQLAEIAIKRPTSRQKLGQISQIHPGSVRRYGELLIQKILDYKDDSGSLPVVINPRELKDLKSLIKLLESKIKEVAKDFDVTPNIMASKRMLKKFAVCYLTGESQAAAWAGWRGNLLMPYFEPVLSQFATSNLTST